MLSQLVVGKSNDDEENGQHSKAHELDWLSADGIHGSDSNPVPWNGTSADDDEVAHGGVVEDLVDVRSLGVPNSLQNDRVVETKTVAGKKGMLAFEHGGTDFTGDTHKATSRKNQEPAVPSKTLPCFHCE